MKDILNYTNEELVNWLRHDAGSSNPDYFNCDKKSLGGLKLQQVPEEFAELLLILKGKKVKRYMELGIGNGGSFFLSCFFMGASLQSAVAVDNLAYGDQIGQSKEEVEGFIMRAKAYVDSNNIRFVQKSTDDYFEMLNTVKAKTMYDVAFIDADHSYEGAKRDYVNVLNYVSPGSIIIFHDIASAACPGIFQLWDEVKRNHAGYKEIIHSTTCGIGVLYI